MPEFYKGDHLKTKKKKENFVIYVADNIYL